jgi:hypothetical protein
VDRLFVLTFIIILSLMVNMVYLVEDAALGTPPYHEAVSQRGHKYRQV